NEGFHIEGWQVGESQLESRAEAEPRWQERQSAGQEEGVASWGPLPHDDADAAVTRALVARAPTRLDFGGGWTDVPPYSEREGGAVCNIAITRYATATVSAGAHAGSP